MHSFTLQGIPIPFHSPRVTRFGTYNPRFKEMSRMKDSLRQQWHQDPLEGALHVDMFFFMPIPKSTSKKNRELMLKGLLHHTKTPDLDNLRKIVSDVLQDRIIKNDSQIAEGRSVKLYSDRPRTVINIYKLELM